MWLSVFLVGVVLFLLYRLLNYWIINPWRIHRDLWAQGIPGEYVPILGDVLKIRRAILADDPMSYYIDRTKKLGSYHHSSFGPIARLMVSDPALIQGVLKINARSYHKSSLMGLIVGVLLGEDNLLMSEDAVHSQHRRLIAPAFPTAKCQFDDFSDGGNHLEPARSMDIDDREEPRAIAGRFS